MGIPAFFKAIYFNETPLTEKDYAKGRTFSIFEGGSARTIFNLTSGAFLAGFASYLGAGDSFNGIICAIPILSCIIQLFSPIVFERMEKRKLLVSLFALLHRVFLGLMVFIPFIAKGETSRLVLVTGIYFISYLAASFINPAASGWMIDLTPDSIRGRYLGIRESYVLATSTVFTLIMGRVMDVFKNAGNEYGGFIIMFSLVLLLAAANFVFLSIMKEPPVKRHKSLLDIKKVVSIPLKDKKFKRIVLLFVLWNIGLQIGGPFFAVYMVTGLKLEYTFIMVVNMLGTVLNVFLVRLWGRMADRKSWLYITKLSILMLAATHFMWLFVNHSTAFILVPLLHMAGGASWAGIGISTFNIQFTFSPEEGRTVYIGFNAALSGLIGFASTLAGSVLLGVFQGFKIDLSGFTIGSMQMIFAASGLLLAVCSAYIHFFVKQAEE